MSASLRERENCTPPCMLKRLSNIQGSSNIWAQVFLSPPRVSACFKNGYTSEDAMNLKMVLSRAEIGDLSLLVKSDLSFPVATLLSSREYDPVSGRNDAKVPTPARAANTHNHDQSSRSNKSCSVLFLDNPIPASSVDKVSAASAATAFPTSSFPCSLSKPR